MKEQFQRRSSVPCPTEQTDGVIAIPLNTWEEFSPFVQEHFVGQRGLIYRGQGDAGWNIVATIDRLERRFNTHKTMMHGKEQLQEVPPVDRRQHLKAFQEACRGRRGTNPPVLSEDEWWALAQHHGLATPMLDWTLSPFVALFFAFEKESNVVNEVEWREPKNRSVFALRVTLLEGVKHAPRVFVPEAHSNYRLVNQAGILLRMPPKTELEGFVRTSYPDRLDVIPGQTVVTRLLWKLLVPNNDRIGCLKYLDKMNINRMSLFPDLDGAATYINALWELDFDSPLGYH